jgi:hypothetical protein
MTDPFMVGIADADELRQEVARLAGALRAIRELGGYPDEYAHRAWQIANAALAGDPFEWWCR